MSSGGKRLIILGLAAIAIATITSSVSLALYRLSGDIYLDRSRPGFLPEEEEIEEKVEETYKVSEYGEINKDTVTEFTTEYKKQLDYIDSYEDPFSTEVLSDKSLGFPAE